MIDTFSWRMKWRRFVVKYRKGEYQPQVQSIKRAGRDVALFVMIMGVGFFVIHSIHKNVGPPSPADSDLTQGETRPPSPTPAEKGSGKAFSPAGNPLPAGLLSCNASPYEYGAEMHDGKIVEYDRNTKEARASEGTWWSCPTDLPSEPVCAYFEVTDGNTTQLQTRSLGNECQACVLDNRIYQFVSRSAEFMGYTKGPCNTPRKR